MEIGKYQTSAKTDRSNGFATGNINEFIERIREEANREKEELKSILEQAKKDPSVLGSLKEKKWSKAHSIAHDPKLALELIEIAKNNPYIFEISEKNNWSVVHELSRNENENVKLRLLEIIADDMQKFGNLLFIGDNEGWTISHQLSNDNSKKVKLKLLKIAKSKPEILRLGENSKWCVAHYFAMSDWYVQLKLLDIIKDNKWVLDLKTEEGLSVEEILKNARSKKVKQKLYEIEAKN